MNTTILKRAFIFILVVFAFFLMILYANEAKDFVASPYLIRHVKKLLNTEESGLENVAESEQFIASPLEDHWTYECSRNRCIRKFNVQGIKQRITFLSCAMVCGNLKVWPNPTKSTFGKSVNSFHLLNVQYQIETQFKNVEEKLEKVMSLFTSDLKKILLSSGGRIDKTNIIDNSTNSSSDTAVINILLHVTKSELTQLTLETNECYSLTISANDNIVNAKISGETFFGVRHGLETLQQIIWYDDVVESFKILSSVSIEDCPKFRYRGIMLDTSRHYFSVETIKRLIVGMSHVKLNRFHWHMTDSQSFPFVSKKYPELSIYGAYSPREVYTHDDIKEIVDFAAIRGIQIIPEIDVPAHAGNGWQWGLEKGLGELSLCINQQPWTSYCGQPSCGQLNPKNNNTYEILESLYEELITLTETTDFFHLGGDEVNFDCWRQYFKDENLNDLWCKFMIKAHERMVRANMNKPMQYAAIWNSDWSKMKCLPPANFSIQVWLAQPMQIKQYIREKYHIVISHVEAWYLDCGFGSWRDTTSQGTCPPFKAWYTMYNYRPWDTLNLNEEQKRQILGGEACMWTEQVNENSIETRIWPRAAAFAERLWNDPKTFVIPKETVNRFSIFQTRFNSLGLKSDALFPKYCEQNEEECI